MQLEFQVGRGRQRDVGLKYGEMSLPLSVPHPPQVRIDRGRGIWDRGNVNDPSKRSLLGIGNGDFRKGLLPVAGEQAESVQVEVAVSRKSPRTVVRQRRIGDGLQTDRTNSRQIGPGDQRVNV